MPQQHPQAVTGPQRFEHATCLLDIGPAVHQRAGLSRYAERLASSLLNESPSDISLALFYNRHSGHGPPATLRSAPAYSIPAGQYQWRLSVLASQLGRLRHRDVDSITQTLANGACQHGSVVYHATEHLLPRLTCPTVLTVHDLIFDRLPEYHTRANRMFLKLGMPLFVHNASLVIAVSHRTRLDLVARYSLSEDRVRVVYEGIDEDYTRSSDDQIRRIRARYSGGEPYLLMVGAIEPRKNHVAAMQALALLHDAGYPHRLLVAGGNGWMYEPILRYAELSPVADRITFLGFVPQRELPALYSAADGFLLPSHYEGFGFTALEAMACGTPVICSNVGSLPEVTGKAAILIEPADIGGLAQSVRNVLDQPRLAETMIRLGRDNASRFQWRTCTRETVAVYREAVALHRG